LKIIATHINNTFGKNNKEQHERVTFSPNVLATKLKNSDAKTIKTTYVTLK